MYEIRHETAYFIVYPLILSFYLSIGIFKMLTLTTKVKIHLTAVFLFLIPIRQLFFGKIDKKNTSEEYNSNFNFILLTYNHFTCI